MPLRKPGLHPYEYAKWLDRDITDPGSLSHVFLPYPADRMEMWPVSQEVNSPKHDRPEFVEPIRQQGELF